MTRKGIIKAQGGLSKVVRKLPNLLLEEVGVGKKAASTFFKHPVVKASYEHNKDIAKRLGITLQDRPKNMAEIVNRPIGIRFMPYSDGEIGALHSSGIDDPNQLLSIAWTPLTESQAKRTGLHESLHRGYYSAPIKYVNTDFDYYKNVYSPAYRYWHWKTSKLLKPDAMDSYLGDIHSGEAGVNLIEVGKEAGVKLGDKWPGDEKFWETVNKWPEDKKFMLDLLNTDTKAGRRHIWDAMAGKYFSIGTAAAFSNWLNGSKDKELKSELKSGGIIKGQKGLIKVGKQVLSTLAKKSEPLYKRVFKIEPTTKRLVEVPKVVSKEKALDWDIDKVGNPMQAIRESAAAQNIDIDTMEGLDKFIDSIDDSSPMAAMKKNYKTYRDELITKDSYHDALTPQEIQKELAFMAMDEFAPNTDNYELIKEFYREDVLPRMLENLKNSGIELKPDEIEEITRVFSDPLEGVNVRMGYSVPGSGGFSSGDKDIVFSNKVYPTGKVPDSTWTHEIHHRLRSWLGHYLRDKGYDINPNPTGSIFAVWEPPKGLENTSDNLTENFLRNMKIRGQYTPQEIELMKPLAMTREYSADKTPIAEIGAVMAANGRFGIWKDVRSDLGRIPTIQEVNEHIRQMPYDRVNGYLYTLPYGMQIGSANRTALDNTTNYLWNRANKYNAFINGWYDELPWYKKMFVRRPQYLAQPRIHEISTPVYKAQGEAMKKAMETIAGVGGVGYLGSQSNEEK